MKYQRRMITRMTPEQEQAMNYIKQKQAQDPNYDPSKDPQYQQMMMQLIPAEIRDISGGVERLKVAFKDSTEGFAFIYLIHHHIHFLTIWLIIRC